MILKCKVLHFQHWLYHFHEELFLTFEMSYLFILQKKPVLSGNIL